MPISVVTTTGISSCLVKLVDTVYDVKSGRGWFNYCTTSVPDVLLSDDTCLVFCHFPPYILVMWMSLSGQQLVCSTTSHHV